MVKLFICSLFLISCIAAAPTGDVGERGSFAGFDGNPIIVFGGGERGSFAFGDDTVEARSLDYGVPVIRNIVPHSEYGAPRAIEVTTTTEPYCDKSDIVPPFADVPSGPEILPLPILPEFRAEIPEVPHAEYGVVANVLPEIKAEIPEVPHAEYGLTAVRIVPEFVPAPAAPEALPLPIPEKPFVRDIPIVEERAPIVSGPYPPRVEPTTTTTTTSAPYPYRGRVESHYDTDSGLVREEFLKGAPL